MKHQIGPFAVPLATLEEGTNRVRLEGSPEEAGITPGDADLTRRIVVVAEFIRSDTSVEIQGWIGTAVRQPCDQCVAPVETEIQAPVRLLCEKVGRRKPKGVPPEGANEPGLMYYDGRVLDIRDEIRELVLLEVPWHPLCREDCKGLCPQCGKDRNLGDCGCPPHRASGPWDALREMTEAEGRPSDASQEKE